MRLPLLLAVAALIAGTPVPLRAQIGGGSIIGMVTDPTAAPVASAQVSVRNVDTGVVRQTQTNETGYYEFPLLPPGRYVIEAERHGFRKAATAVFALHAGTRPRIDLSLELGQLTESVNVVAEAPAVNATTTDLGVVMTQSKIESLPLNGRNFEQLVGLQAGVLTNPSSSAGGRGGIEFHGSTALGNAIVLDGVDLSFGEVNSTASDRAAGGGQALINAVSVEAIEEFKATGSAFSAEYGRAIGGVLMLTTKAGTNEFHGVVFDFFRNDKLDANSFFSNVAGLPKPPLRWNQFGGNLGGPIRRNRAFFFFNYEGAQVRRASQVTGNVATPALIAQLKPALQAVFREFSPTELTPTANPLVGFHRRNDRIKNEENTYLSRIDVDLSRRRITFRYGYNDQDITTPTLPPAMPRLFPMRLHNAVLQDSWTLGPAMFNELRLGVNRVDLNRMERNRDRVPAWISVAGVGVSISQPGYLHFMPTTYTLADNLSIISGKHSVKAGIDIRRVDSARDQGGQPTHMYNSLNDLIADRPNRVRLLFGGGKWLRTINYGFYLQDDWRLWRRLQLNAGLRYEYSPPFRGGFNVASSDPFGSFIPTARSPMFAADRNNWGPRVGLVFDPLGNQRFVLRAGAAVTYLPQQTIFYMDMAFLDPRLPFVADVVPAEIPGAPSAFPFPQSFVQMVAANPALLPPGFVVPRQIVDYNRRDSYGGLWNFSLQGAVTGSLSLQASYVGSRNVKLSSPRNVNLIDPALGRRPRPEFGDVNFMENAANISYHALQLSANQRIWRGLSFDASYSFGKAIGYYVPDGTITFTLSQLQDPYNIAGSRGVKNGDIRHRVVGTFSYYLPAGRLAQTRGLRTVFGGWTAQGILVRRSGLPINVLAGVLLAPNGRVDGQRPDWVGGANPYRRDSQALTWLNPTAFDIVRPRAERRFGNLGYNALRGPSGFSMDAALHKQWQLRERQRLVFRFEMFNALNHKILGNPVSTVNNPNFGKITSASGGRNIQLALKYHF